MISGDECGLNFLTFCLTIEEKLRKKLSQKTDPTWDRTLAFPMRQRRHLSETLMLQNLYIHIKIKISKLNKINKQRVKTNSQKTL